MPATLDSIRTPLPGSDRQSATASLHFDMFSCEQVRLISEDGASGLVYEGISKDYYGTQSAAAAKLIIKECYPFESAAFLQRDGDTLRIADDAPAIARAVFEQHVDRFRAAFSKHTHVYQGPAREQVSVPGHACEANGTAYIVTDVSNGVTLDEAVEHMDFPTKLMALIRLCEALEAIHESGYVYLDCKPSNILVVQSSSGGERRFTGDVRLFDFDSMLAVDELGSPDIVVPGSGEWSAYEQTHPGYATAVGTRSDVYAVGALLFWMVAGRTPTSNEVIHAYGTWELDDAAIVEPTVREAGERARELVRKMLEHTLTVDPQKRYESIALLAADFESLRSMVTGTDVEKLADERTEERMEEVRQKTIRWFQMAIMAVLSLILIVVVVFVVVVPQLAPREPDLVEGMWYSLSNDMLKKDANVNGASKMAEYLDGFVELKFNGDGTWRMYFPELGQSFIGEWSLIGEDAVGSEPGPPQGFEIPSAGLLQTQYKRIYSLTSGNAQVMTFTIWNAKYWHNMWGQGDMGEGDEKITRFYAREGTAAHGDK